jgi:CO/xanthine dehydrogenase Mo-binding subunit
VKKSAISRGALIPTAPAILNAIYDAIGARLAAAMPVSMVTIAKRVHWKIAAESGTEHLRH